MKATLREFYSKGMLKMFPHLQRRLDIANAYQRTFDSKEGRLVLRDLLTLSDFLGVDGEMVRDEAVYRIGRRSIVATILQRLRWSESELLRLGEEMTFEDVAMQEAQRELEIAA